MKNIGMPFVVAIALALGMFATASAQTVYRCGDSYSQKPCAGGRAVDVEDPRSPTQREQARTAAQRDARTAQAMERDRLKAEAAAAPRPQRAASASPAQGKKLNAGSKPPKPAKPVKAIKPLVIVPPVEGMRKPATVPSKPAG